MRPNVKSYLEKYILLARTIREIVRQPQWAVVIGVTAFCALTQATATLGAQIIVLLLAAYLAIGASTLLGMDGLGPISVLKSLFHVPSWKNMMIALLCISAAIGLMRLAGRIDEFVSAVSEAVKGDKDLLTALLVAVTCSLFVACFYVFLKWRSNVEMAAVYAGGLTHGPAPSRGEQIDYWRKLLVSLCLCVVALVPAALLANWAWNVLASLVLPVFLISLERRRATPPA
jgi:hypothetical protein